MVIQCLICLKLFNLFANSFSNLVDVICGLFSRGLPVIVEETPYFNTHIDLVSENCDEYLCIVVCYSDEGDTGEVFALVCPVQKSSTSTCL